MATAAPGSHTGAQCFIQVHTAEGAAVITTSKGKEQHEQDHPGPAGVLTGSPSAVLRPVELVARAADMYSNEPKMATVLGGVMTLLALAAALAYTVYQVRVAGLLM